MDAREERLARNELLFRDLNEQVEFVATRWTRMRARSSSFASAGCGLQLRLPIISPLTKAFVQIRHSSSSLSGMTVRRSRKFSTEPTPTRS